MENKTQIDLMIYMLDDIRKITLAGVRNLTNEQLFQPPVEGEYPIGAYLMHLGECDLGWLKSLSGEEQPEDLKKRVYYNSWFDSAPEDFAPPSEPIEPEEYINAITEARERERKYISSMTDIELEDMIIRKRDGKEIEIPKKWIIYHLIEHEAHTRGQMFLLMRKAGLKNQGENNRLG